MSETTSTAVLRICRLAKHGRSPGAVDGMNFSVCITEEAVLRVSVETWALMVVGRGQLARGGGACVAGRCTTWSRVR
jgi:hypothetical protein